VPASVSWSNHRRTARAGASTSNDPRLSEKRQRSSSPYTATLGKATTEVLPKSNFGLLHNYHQTGKRLLFDACSTELAAAPAQLKGETRCARIRLSSPALRRSGSSSCSTTARARIQSV
jgi:hypothetical protein